MVNLYKCEKCGWSGEIPEMHGDNEKINVAGILYLDSCEHCNDRRAYWDEKLI